MKALPLFSICVFSCFIQKIQAQENKKLDSLIKTYQSQRDNKEKVHTLESLFHETIGNDDQENANKYARWALALSKKLNYLEGEGRAEQNLGHFYGVLKHPDSFALHYENATAIFSQLNDKKEVFNSLHRWSRFENLEGNFDKALELSKKSLTLAKDLKNGSILSDAFQRRASIYLDNGNYKLATETLLKASKALDTINPKDFIKQAIIIVGIARTQLLRENYNAAIPSLFEGLKIFKKKDDVLWQSITMLEIGSAYYGLKNWESALENYTHSLKLGRELKRDDIVDANLVNIAAIHIEKKEFDKALQYLFESNKISQRKVAVNNQIVTYNDIATAYLGKKDYDSAIVNYSAAIHLADSIKSIDKLSDAYRERSGTYEKMQNFRKALEDHKKFQLLRDSIFNTTKSQQIEELLAKYETEKKEQEIALQKKEIETLEQKAEITNLQRILFGTGLVLSLGILGIGFYGFRQKIKRSKAEKEKVDAELAFKKKELTTHALHLAKKNEVLESVKQKAKELKLGEKSPGYTQLIKTINFDQQNDKNWENFTQYFEQVHKDFASKVKAKYPEVTKNELRFMALLKMNMSSKEIATILNITSDGVKKVRQRLRKKMNLQPQDSLENIVMDI